MKKILVTLMIGSLLSAAVVTPALAHDWDHPHVPGGIFNPLWPVAAALAIPAAVVGAIASAADPGPVVVAPPAPVAPPVYSAPPAYYAPRVYVAPRPYYYAPRGYSYGYHRPHYQYGW